MSGSISARDFDRNPFLPCLRLAGPAVTAVEVMGSGVTHPREQVVDELHPEWLSVSVPEAVPVQIGREVLDAKRTGLPIAKEIEPEGELHDLGFLGLDGELPLLFVAVPLNDVTVRYPKGGTAPFQ